MVSSSPPEGDRLGVAFVSEAVPLTAAAAVTAGPSAVSAAYFAAPYSGAIVDFTFGWFTSIGPPKGLGGYAGSFARWVFDTYKSYFLTTHNATPCEK